jgi:L-2-hydroxyglutarate oxidase LhgO
MNDKYRFDIVIIGAGIVGLAIANEVSKVYKNVLVIEKEKAFGQHTSSRNSEIIHSGIYYPKEALKTKLCVEGNRLLYEFLAIHKIPHRKCGKLIVANSPGDESALETLYQQGVENGVSDLSLISKKEAKEYEPSVRASRAILAPSTGIVDSHSLMRRLEQKSIEQDVIFSYNTEINKIFKKNDTYELTVDNEEVIIETEVLINSAGLWSDRVSDMAGITGYKIHWNKGEYFKTTRYKNMNKLIYPAPDPKGKYLGIHTVMDLDGNISFGPNSYYVDELQYDINESNKEQFCSTINRYLDIQMQDLSPAMSGIRPKIQAKNEHFKDFVIKNESKVGYNNFINLIGIESPGLTCCLSISKYVKEIIEK